MGVAIPAIGLAITAASTAATIAAQQKAADANAKIARNNALLTQYQSGGAQEQAAANIAGIMAQAQRVSARNRAAQAVSGAGGAVYDKLVAMSAVSAGLDAERIRAAAARQAWGMDIEAGNYEFSAQQSINQGILGGAATGLSGLSQAVGVYGPMLYKS